MAVVVCSCWRLHYRPWTPRQAKVYHEVKAICTYMLQITAHHSAAVILHMCLLTIPQVPLVICNKCPVSVHEQCSWAFTEKANGSFGAHSVFMKVFSFFKKLLESFYCFTVFLKVLFFVNCISVLH